MDVVAVAMEYRMISGANNYVKIAGCAALPAGVALAGNPYALSVARACLNANFERLGAAEHAFSVADRAR